MAANSQTIWISSWQEKLEEVKQQIASCKIQISDLLMNQLSHHCFFSNKSKKIWSMTTSQYFFKGVIRKYLFRLIVFKMYYFKKFDLF